jgi:hypothetical protein
MLPLNGYRRWDYQMRNPLVSLSAQCCPQYEYNGVLNNVWAEPRLDPEVPGFSFPDWEGVDDRALVIAAIADVLPNLDALTTAVESRQTIRMVLKARNDAKSLIREALRGGKHTVKAASDAWLAWRYGWQQLGYDCQNVRDFIVTPTTPLVLSGQSGISVPSLEVASGDFGSTSDRFSTYTDRLEWDVSYRARVLAKFRYSTLNAVMDVPLTAWELVPYSFVADWFVNIGDCLAAWKVRRTCERMYASLGHKATGQRTHTVEQTPATNCSSFSFRPSYHETVSLKTRMPTGIPELVPSITVNLTSPRITDAAALLAKRIL